MGESVEHRRIHALYQDESSDRGHKMVSVCVANVYAQHCNLMSFVLCLCRWAIVGLCDMFNRRCLTEERYNTILSAMADEVVAVDPAAVTKSASLAQSGASDSPLILEKQCVDILFCRSHFYFPSCR